MRFQFAATILALASINTAVASPIASTSNNVDNKRSASPVEPVVGNVERGQYDCVGKCLADGHNVVYCTLKCELPIVKRAASPVEAPTVNGNVEGSVDCIDACKARGHGLPYCLVTCGIYPV